MLVETCSSIGQEVPKPAPKPRLPERKSLTPPQVKLRSPPRHSPPQPYPAAALLKAQTAQQAALASQQSAVFNNNNLASLTAQYQAMYQQMLAQTELEYMRALRQEKEVKTKCPMCSLLPGYAGHCIHSMDLSKIMANPLMGSIVNPMDLLAMQNMSLARMQQSVSPQSAPSTTSSPITSPRTISPKRETTRSPETIRECHWVDHDGYCGIKFRSQDDLMEHLKVHVLSKNDSCRSKSISDLSVKHHQMRFNPYKVDRSMIIKHWQEYYNLAFSTSIPQWFILYFICLQFKLNISQTLPLSQYHNMIH